MIDYRIIAIINYTLVMNKLSYLVNREVLNLRK